MKNPNLVEKIQNSIKMRKIVFLSGMAFDTNLSVIKRLREMYDVWVLFLCNNGIESRIGRTVNIMEDIIQAKDVKEFRIFDGFLDLNKTFLIRHKTQKELGWKYLWERWRIDRKIHNFLGSIRPDIVLQDTSIFQYTSLSYRKKIVRLVHDPFPHSGENNIKRKLLDLSMQKLSARYILFNEAQKEEFIVQRKLNPKFVFSAFLSIYEMLDLYNNASLSLKRNVLFWGRISKYKGIEYLIEGFRKYIEKTGDKIATLTIAGAGSYYFDIDEAIKGCNQITVIKRFLSMPELTRAIKECYIVVCPYTDATQSGVVMSAFAMEKPVLATNVGGLPEMLNNGLAGMLIEPKDSDAICNALQTLFTHPELLRDYQDNIKKMYFNGGCKSWEEGVKGIQKAIDSIE